MTWRGAVGLAAAMVVVLALVKFAGKSASGVNAISPARIALAAIGNPWAEAGWWDSVTGPMAAGLAAVDGLTPVLVGTPVTGDKTEGLRDIRFNYQAGSILLAEARIANADTNITWTFIESGGYQAGWTRTESFINWNAAALAAAADTIGKLVAHPRTSHD